MADEKKAKSARLLEAASHVLAGAGGAMLITSLNKALFYLDVRALLQLGSPVTGTTFIAVAAGPVVAHYQKRLVAALEDADLATQSDEDDGSKPVSLTREPPEDCLSHQENMLARELGAWAKRRTAGQLSDLSHKNAGWLAAWSTGLEKGGPAKPIDLLVAIQQLADDDDWLSRDMDTETAQAFEAADTGTGESW